MEHNITLSLTKAFIRRAAAMGYDVKTVNVEYDCQGVHWGHYYETNYEDAKHDFAIRAGLIKESQLFTKEELVALYGACVFRGRNDDEISYEDDKKLQAVMEKMEQIKKKYPMGIRIELDHMEGEADMPDGLRGTVKHVDDHAVG